MEGKIMKVNNGLVLVVLLIAGCASSPSQLYPEFQAAAQDISTLSLAVDFVATRDVQGDIHLVETSENRVATDLLTKALREELENRGYSITAATQSVGRILPEDTDYRVMTDSNQETDVEALPVQRAPISVDEEILPEINERMTAAFRALPKALQARKDGDVGARTEGFVFGDAQANMLVSGNTHRISSGKLLGANAVGITLAVFTGVGFTQSNPPIAFRVAIVDPADGAVQWANEFQYAGSPKNFSNPKRLKYIVRALLKQLPPRGK
ncbi:MAG: DUF4136 domain-containing protein [Gammaproteobacteria bacterium]|nr:DUF4136 domain-containing protein [Gammaproteobacteria bacterium]